MCLHIFCKNHLSFNIRIFICLALFLQAVLFSSRVCHTPCDKAPLCPCRGLPTEVVWESWEGGKDNVITGAAVASGSVPHPWLLTPVALAKEKGFAIFRTLPLPLLFLIIVCEDLGAFNLCTSVLALRGLNPEG